MSREWQPGDVAMLSGRGGTELGICYEPGIVTERGSKARWRTAGLDRWSSVSEARPLVVIDPEDREQVARLAVAYMSANPGVASIEPTIHGRLTNALREFADPTPPKPVEPTGLGAVVEDIEGVRWTRVEAGEPETRNPWYPADCDFQPDEWHNLCAVRVLSEGVTP